MRSAVLRGVTLVEVLVVIVIMTLISSTATYLVFPELKRARIKSALLGASVIKTAAQTYVELDLHRSMDACPTIEELVVMCADMEINVLSSGVDRIKGTEDDIWDDFRPEDLERVEGL